MLEIDGQLKALTTYRKGQETKFANALMADKIATSYLNSPSDLSKNTDPYLTEIISNPNFLRGVRRIVFSLGIDIGEFPVHSSK